ncbi:MAG: TldD/PmbA family protein [Clostridia bacterium]|nr:TldD/PmbA family protein [Clostridia bacterium]
MNFDQVKNILVSEADRRGLSEYEVYFMETGSMGAETLKDEISSFSSGVRGGVSFRCIVGGRLGAAATELMEEHEMRELVDRAVQYAAVIESDDPVIFYDGAESYATKSVLNAETPDAATLKSVALELQRKTYGASDLIADGTQSGTFAGTVRRALVNSHGLNLSDEYSASGAYVQAVVEKDGESQDAFDCCLGLDPCDLEQLSVNASKDAIAKIGAEEIDSGKYDVIIQGKQMRDLLSTFSSVFSAKSAHLGLSLLKGKEGSAIASDAVTLIDDPMRKDFSAQATFDGEGVATQKKSVIEQGVLTTLLYDLSTAKKAGKMSTGNGQRKSYASPVSISPYSFYFAGGELSEDELKIRLDHGIYLTELKGLHAGANDVTGDFSIESAGFLVEDGKISKAIKSFTVAGNFFDLLKNIEALSDTVRFDASTGFTSYGSPDVLVRNMSVAGK